MRKTIILLALISTIAISCNDEVEIKSPYEESGVLITPLQIGSIEFLSVSGNFTSDFTMTADNNWVLNGAVLVESGATLSIEPGTNIYGAFGEETAYLSVQRGATIMAEGTAEQPITFSTIRKVTSIPQPGDWGGIIVNGRAPVNTPSGEGIGEGGSGNYGGNDANDNSGTLRYVIVEYGGKVLGLDDEMNNISLNACGSGTTVDYVQALYGNDDGIEIFGGTVNVKHAISMGNGDDSFDWTYGWVGYGQHWLVVQGDHDGDRGIEADNNEDNFEATPNSFPIVSNVTIIGSNDGDNANTGVKLRHGTQGYIYNAIVTNFSKHGVEVDDISQNYIGNQLRFRYSNVFGNALDDETGENFKDCLLFELDLTNSTDEFILTGVYRGVGPNGYDASQEDAWFDATDYIGAVPTDNDWTLWANQLR